jgi:hypothetical protein
LIEGDGQHFSSSIESRLRHGYYLTGHTEYQNDEGWFAAGWVEIVAAVVTLEARKGHLVKRWIMAGRRGPSSTAN